MRVAGWMVELLTVSRQCDGIVTFFLVSCAPQLHLILPTTVSALKS